MIMISIQMSQQDLLFEVSGGQFYDYENNQLCNNPPCPLTQIGTNSLHHL